MINQKVKVRNSNIDFIRIIGMFAIIIHHLLQYGGAYVKYKKFIKPIFLLNIFCMWHVSSFGIVSGLIGNKTHKFSTLFYLWIQTLFYSLLFYIKYNINTNQIFTKNLIPFLFPVIYKKYWYFSAYFGIFPFLNFISGSISSLPIIEVKKSIYFMIGIFIIWSSFHTYNFVQNLGYSPFTLLIFYIFGAYIGKYKFFFKRENNNRFLICLFCAAIFIIVSLSCYFINISKINIYIKNLFIIRVNSFPMLLQIFSIVTFVSQIKFCLFISKIITFIGPLTFDVYLIHENPFIRDNYMRNFFMKQSIDLSLQNLFVLIFKRATYIFTICIIFAFIRNIIFKLLKIRNICNKWESLTNKIIDYYLI